MNNRPRLERIVYLLALLAAACGRVSGQSAAPPNDHRPLVFRGARVIVGDGRVIDDAAFIVRDGLLMQVGRSGEVTAPPDAVTIDVRGKTVMPAIVNAHSH